MRKTLAVVIRTADFNDSDRMLTLLTKDFGLMAAKVKGAKKQTGKLFAASALFCCGEYEFYEKNGFFGVRSCNIRHSFYRLQSDYDAFSAACFIADAAGKVAQEEYAEPKLFVLVASALFALDGAAVSPQAVLCYFIARLLLIEGVYPSLEHCVLCGSVDVTRFSAQLGGALCAVCAKDRRAIRADAAFLAAMQGMARILPRDIKDVRIEERVQKKLTDALVEYLENVLQKPLKTSKFIKNPRRQNN